MSNAAPKTLKDLPPPQSTPATFRRDGWQNSITGLGDINRDKRLQAGILGVRLQYQDLEELYRSDDIIGRCVDIIPDEETREGWEVLVPGDPDAARRMNDKLAELQIENKIQECRRWSRAYGGAGMVLGLDDGAKDPVQPLREDKIQDVVWTTNASAQELIPYGYYSDPFQAQYGLPEFYQFVPTIGASPVAYFPGFSSKSRLSLVEPNAYAIRYVHESRIIRFEGVVVSRRQEREKLGWGDSIVVRILETARDFSTAYAGASALVGDFSQAILKIKGLTHILASGDDSAVKTRAALIDFTRSVARMVLLDADGEEFERKATPVTGLPELLEKFAIRLSAAVGIPVTILMGQSPAGLQATGASDIRWFYDRVRASQRKYILPPLKRIISLLFKSKRGPTLGKVPERWEVTFRPLWSPDLKDITEAHLKQAQSDSLYFDRSMAAPSEISKSRFGGTVWSAETHLQPELRDAEGNLKTPNLIPGAGGAEPKNMVPGDKHGKPSAEAKNTPQDNSGRSAIELPRGGDPGVAPVSGNAEIGHAPLPR